MRPDEVRLVAELVRDRRVHCVSDEAVRALALRVLELESAQRIRMAGVSEGNHGQR